MSTPPTEVRPNLRLLNGQMGPEGSINKEVVDPDRAVRNRPGAPVIQPPVETCSSCRLGAAGDCPFSKKYFDRGSTVVRQGDVPPAVGFIKEGLVAVSSHDREGNHVATSLRGPRTLVALDALSHRVSSDDVKTLEPTDVCVCPTPALEKWLNTASGARAMTDLLLQELEARRWETDLTSGPADRRVARLLIAWNRSVASPRPHVSHALLARMVGLRAETLSRVLRRFKTNGLLKTDADLEIADLNRLTELSEQVDA